MLMARALPEAWRIAPCDNCGGGTCSQCEDTQTGIRLCPDCAGVIKGLTSIRVMEALLRNKRLKTGSPRHDTSPWKTMFFPGISRTLGGDILAGFMLSFLGAGAIACLAWNGGCFKDPLLMSVSAPVWNILLPCAVLIAAWVLSRRRSVQREPRNYHVFPAEIRMQETKKAADTHEEPPDPWKEYEAGKSERAKRLSEFRKIPDADEAFSGEIEKGSKWH
jgi:hypothetical protein